MSSSKIEIETVKGSGIFEDVSDRYQEIKIASNPSHITLELKFFDTDSRVVSENYLKIKDRFRDRYSCPRVRMSEEAEGAEKTYQIGEFILGENNRTPSKGIIGSEAYITLIAENGLTKGMV